MKKMIKIKDKKIIKRLTQSYKGVIVG